ncbi:Gfo/Idh/MocA family protein [Natronolimnobius baerhuensis]|uniref:Oxidoreductase n=1 Tax=Natronolimnobius baerhuensis TaxID=253108 RepID=A0A202E8T8_9EURY|nr:Gfo/Idh/MocA family oxidoreductase [Natronolimnobius baerhuensis]OVE84696.1 hypothetical protein B2G88_09935 [Natronolimnobius baerhuensis]
MTRVGLIGAGGILSMHLPAYRAYSDRIELAAVCDADETRANEVAEEFDVDIWTDFESMVAEADIDAVDITLPHHLHYPAAKAALEAGKHVLVEKPFTTSVADARELVSLAADRQLTLMVGQMQRFHPAYRELKHRLEDGDLGQIHHARVDAVANQGDMYGPSHWLYDGKKAGGGAVIGYAIHKLDLLRYLLGDIDRAISWQQTVDDRYDDAEDFSVGLLSFEEGTVADFFTTTSAAATPYNEMLWLYGASGTVHSLPLEGGQEEGYVGTPPPKQSVDAGDGLRKQFQDIDPDEVDLPTGNAFTNEILHFADCIEAGEEPISSGRDNLGTIATVAAIYRSAQRDGEAVRTEDVLAVPTPDTDSNSEARW